MDGGVLAGLFVSRGMESPKRPLTVTFQTTILFGSGLVRRRETVDGMAIREGVCLELVKDSWRISRKRVLLPDDRSEIEISST